MGSNRVRPIVPTGVGIATAIAAGWREGHVSPLVRKLTAGLCLAPGEDLLVASAGAPVVAGDLSRHVATPVTVVAVVTSDTPLLTGQAARLATSGRTTSWSDRASSCLEAPVGPRERLPSPSPASCRACERR